MSLRSPRRWCSGSASHDMAQLEQNRTGQSHVSQVFTSAATSEHVPLLFSFRSSTLVNSASESTRRRERWQAGRKRVSLPHTLGA